MAEHELNWTEEKNKLSGQVAAMVVCEGLLSDFLY